MAEIKAGVLLQLKDSFSAGIDKASQKVNAFTGKMQGAFSKLDGIINSTASNLATFGVSIGVGATINKMIDFEDRINKIGAIAKSNAKDVETFEKQMAGLSEEIYKTATLPDIKVDASDMVSAIEVIMTETGDMDYARKNLENIGRAMSAFDVDGAAVGGMMSQFAKLGYTAEETSKLMNDLYIQGNKGAFTAGEFAKNGSAIIAAYSRIGTTAKDIKNANAALEIFTMNTKSPVESVTVLESIMAELADPSKQEQLKELGRELNVDLSVRDSEGNFRDLNDILLKIISTKDKLGNLDRYGKIFGQVAMRAVSAFDIYSDKLPDIRNATGSATAFLEASENNAKSLKANLRNLQTAFDSFASSNLTTYLKRITAYLNWFAKDPKRFDALFRTLAKGFGIFMGAKLVVGIGNAITGIKGIGSAMSSLSGNMKGLSSAASGGNAIPVYVTNWGGSQANDSDYAGGNASGPISRKPTAKTYARNIAGAGAFAAAMSIPTVIQDFISISSNEEMTNKEKNIAKGESIGKAGGLVLGSMGGAAAGTAIGAAIGSVVPVIGTAIGGVVGMGIGTGIGYLGSFLGGKLGGKIGEKLSKEEALSEISQEIKNQEAAKESAKVEMQGNATIGVEIGLTDTRTWYKTFQKQNSINNLNINTGSYKELNGAY